MAPRNLTGTLVVIATPIGNVDHLTPQARRELELVDDLACEDTRRTGRLLAAAGIPAPRLRSVRRENEAAAVDWALDRLEAGRRVGLVSDAGLPGISDPGRRVVAGVRDADGEVVVVPGRSAVSEAVARVPWTADGFVMEGFPPRSGADRRRVLERVAGSPLPTVLFESPRRVEATLADLAEVCGDQRRTMVAKELTKTHERVVLGTPLTPIGEPLGEFVVLVDRRPGDR
ncbi:MAG: ribosomal RNA small subunit methyltransferase I [Microthrixaceae bacterium]